MVGCSQRVNVPVDSNIPTRINIAQVFIANSVCSQHLFTTAGYVLQINLVNINFNSGTSQTTAGNCTGDQLKVYKSFKKQKHQYIPDLRWRYLFV
jgi:hypothetical protein